MSSKKRGLVLSGPMDGKMSEHWAPYMKTPIARDIPTVFAEYQDDFGALVTDTFVYQHTELVFRSDDEGRQTRYGFWVPESEKSPNEFAIKHLAEFYARTAPNSKADK